MRNHSAFFSAIATIVFLLLFSQHGHSQLQWQPLPGPEAGRIWSLGVDGAGRLLAGTEDGGLYRHDMQSGRWSFSALVGSTVRSLYRHSTGRLLAGLQNGLMQSTDDGTTWTDTGLPFNQQGFGLAIAGDGAIYVGGWQGLHRSEDDGSSFQEVALGVSNPRINSLAVTDMGTLFVGMHQGGVLRSTDRGTTWTQADTRMQGTTVNSILVAGTTILVACSGHDVFRSTDDGATWSPSGSTFAHYSFSALLAGSGSTRWLASDYGEIYRSTDDGVSWTIRGALPGAPGILSLAGNASGDLFAGTGTHGVYVSSDEGVTWSTFNSGLSNVLTESVALDGGNTLYLCHRSGAVERGSDGGMSWSVVGDPENYDRIVAIGPGDEVFSARVYSGVWRSSDRGANWRPDTVGLPVFSPSALAISRQGDIAIGGRDGECHVRKSGDVSYSDIAAGLGGSEITLLRWVDDALYAGTTANGLLRTTDYGQTWTKLDQGMKEMYIIVLERGPQNSLLAGGFGSVYQSTDMGDSWTDIGRGIGTAVTGVAMLDDGTLFCSTRNRGILMYAPTSGVWSEANTGLHNPWIDRLLFDGNGTLYAATRGNGLFRAAVSPTGVDTWHPVARGIRMQVFPQPASGDAHLRVGLDAPAILRVSIHDLAGRECLRLADRHCDAGEHSLPLSVTGLSPGVYLCRVSTSDAVLTLPVLLTR